MVMRASRRHPDAGVCEAVAGAETRGGPRAPRPPRAIVRIVRVGHVINVDPSLRRVSAHVANNFSIGGAPREPDSVSGHAGSNLSLGYQRLITGRKALINFGILGNAVLSCLATRKNQCASCEAKRQRLGKNSTFHADDHMCRLSRVNYLQLC